MLSVIRWLLSWIWTIWIKLMFKMKKKCVYEKPFHKTTHVISVQSQHESSTFIACRCPLISKSAICNWTHFKLLCSVCLSTNSVSAFSRDFSRKHTMTESPRRPLMNEWSKTGYRSYTSPNDRLSKRLGASLPNLEQPASDTMTAIISHRAPSLRKMTPDAG